MLKSSNCNFTMEIGTVAMSCTSLNQPPCQPTDKFIWILDLPILVNRSSCGVYYFKSINQYLSLLVHIKHYYCNGQLLTRNKHENFPFGLSVFTDFITLVFQGKVQLYNFAIRWSILHEWHFVLKRSLFNWQQIPDT